MRNLLFLLIFVCGSACAANIPSMKTAKSTDLADCELALKGEGREYALTVMRKRLKSAAGQSSFAQILSGVKPEALKLFNIDPKGPQMFSMKLSKTEQDQFNVQLRDVSQALLDLPLESDPIFVWRQLTMEKFDEIVGRGQGQLYDFAEFQKPTRSDYTYGSRASLEGINGGRFVAVKHKTENSVRLILGLDVPCAEVPKYLDDNTPLLFLILFEPKTTFLCRIDVMSVDFTWAPEPAPASVEPKK